jgi:hypothetical protein
VKGNEHEKPNKGHAALKILAEHIAQQLEERGFCVVFEDDLKRCWPSNQMPEAERNREIHRFAESQGWSATILDGVFGTRQYSKNGNRVLLITKALSVSLAESNLSD